MTLTLSSFRGDIEKHVKGSLSDGRALRRVRGCSLLLEKEVEKHHIPTDFYIVANDLAEWSWT